MIIRYKKKIVTWAKFESNNGNFIMKIKRVQRQIDIARVTWKIFYILRILSSTEFIFICLANRIHKIKCFFLLLSDSLLIRKDLRDLFDQLAVTRKSNKKLNSEKSRSAPELCAAVGPRKIGKYFVVYCV